MNIKSADNQLPHDRYDENAPGDFYVEKDFCIICRLPEHEAPELMGFSDSGKSDNANSHCFFKKQPSGSFELRQAISAMNVCCCGALRYSGKDPLILQRLCEVDLGNQCDVLE